MRALVQRVSEAAVHVDGKRIGQTGPGLLILVCAMQGDTEANADTLAAKVSKLRIFKDDAGKMNRSLQDTGAERLYNHFADQLAALGIPTERGQFGADMKVSLLNDGPVTIWMEF